MPLARQSPQARNHIPERAHVSWFLLHPQNVLCVLVPLQFPEVAVSVWPCCAMPDTVGCDVSVGGVGWTTAVGEDVAGMLPPAFDAVTTTTSVPPTSALATE